MNILKLSILNFILNFNYSLFSWWSFVSQNLLGFLDDGLDASFHGLDLLKSIELGLYAFIGVGETLKLALKLGILLNQNFTVSL